jgi:hypothetical protein
MAKPFFDVSAMAEGDAQVRPLEKNAGARANGHGLYESGCLLPSTSTAL